MLLHVKYFLICRKKQYYQLSFSLIQYICIYLYYFCRTLNCRAWALTRTPRTITCPHSPKAAHIIHTGTVSQSLIHSLISLYLYIQSFIRSFTISLFIHSFNNLVSHQCVNFDSLVYLSMQLFIHLFTRLLNYSINR